MKVDDKRAAEIAERCEMARRAGMTLPDMNDLLADRAEAAETLARERVERAVERAEMRARIEAVEAAREFDALAESEAVQREARLREALLRLRNEVRATLYVAEPDMRAGAGNTNVAVLILRVEEAEAALAEPADTTALDALRTALAEERKRALREAADVVERGDLAPAGAGGSCVECGIWTPADQRHDHAEECVAGRREHEALAARLRRMADGKEGT